ncbi:MAG: hypothetical protein WB769_13355, partial [Pseudolabrys sp.]
ILCCSSKATNWTERKSEIEATMKNRTMSRAFTIAAIAFAAVFVASAAHAFSMQDSNGPVSGQGYLELDKPAAAPDRMAPVNRFGNENGQATIKQGNSTFQFGNQQSFGQRYNTDNIFNPYARDGR